MFHFTLCAIIAALASSLAHAAGDGVLSTSEFLAQHPQIPVGRAALAVARDNLDDRFTFTAIGQPAAHVILVQAFAEGADPADHDAALYSVALVGDDAAETYYAELKGHDEALMGPEERAYTKRGDCDGCPVKICARQPHGGVFGRALGCNQLCRAGQDCTGDARCPICYYIAGNCRWQKRCREKDML